MADELREKLDAAATWASNNVLKDGPMVLAGHAERIAREHYVPILRRLKDETLDARAEVERLTALLNSPTPGEATVNIMVRELTEALNQAVEGRSGLSGAARCAAVADHMVTEAVQAERARFRYLIAAQRTVLVAGATVPEGQSMQDIRSSALDDLLAALDALEADRG